jgi:hypothetical protein
VIQEQIIMLYWLVAQPISMDWRAPSCPSGHIGLA